MCICNSGKIRPVHETDATNPNQWLRRLKAAPPLMNRYVTEHFPCQQPIDQVKGQADTQPAPSNEVPAIQQNGSGQHLVQTNECGNGTFTINGNHNTINFYCSNTATQIQGDENSVEQNLKEND